MSNRPPFRSVLLFGPPGAGKGTQGKILGSVPGFFHLSVGDVFRSIDIGSREGQEICKYTSVGKFVPNDLTIKIWRNALEAYIALAAFKPREDILILDGIPRNVTQTELIREHIDVVKIVSLDCDEEDEMVQRIQRRAIRENRADDASEDIIRRRFEVYRNESRPVLDCYDSDIIAPVEAKGSPAEVLASILNIVIPVQNDHFRAPQNLQV
ncbi:MAG: nucleoside monophosphate kinase [Planctomycetota bacterium]